MKAALVLSVTGGPTGGRLSEGACFNYKIKSGQSFWRCSSGGGDYGDPLERNPALVIEDLADGYVSVERAKKDDGVVVRTISEDLAENDLDFEATQKERAFIRSNCRQWLQEDPEKVRLSPNARILERLRQTK